MNSNSSMPEDGHYLSCNNKNVDLAFSLEKIEKVKDNFSFYSRKGETSLALASLGKILNNLPIIESFNSGLSRATHSGLLTLMRENKSFFSQEKDKKCFECIYQLVEDFYLMSQKDRREFTLALLDYPGK